MDVQDGWTLRLFLLMSFAFHVVTGNISGADPGFPVGGGGRGPILGDCGHPTQELSDENACGNERIGSRRGGGRATEIFVCRSVNAYFRNKINSLH